MPEQETLERAEQDKREGKSPSTQAGEFVREEIHHIREGKHGAASAKQAVAIGLSKARRAGVDLPPPKKAARQKRRGRRRSAIAAAAVAAKRKCRPNGRAAVKRRSSVSHVRRRHTKRFRGRQKARRVDGKPLRILSSFGWSRTSDLYTILRTTWMTRIYKFKMVQLNCF